MKRVRGVFILGLTIGWLMGISPMGSALVSNWLSADASAQTSAPADNDDHSDDGAAVSDFTLPNRRIEFHVPVPMVLRLKSVTLTFNPPAGRKITSFVLPRVWQFVERAAAAPRAPSFRA